VVHSELAFAIQVSNCPVEDSGYLCCILKVLVGVDNISSHCIDLV